MNFRSIYLVGTFPDQANTNRNIRAFMADGMQEAVGETSAVFDLSPAQFYKDAEIGDRDFCLFVGSVLSPDYCVESLLDRARNRRAKTAVWLHDDPYEFDASTRVSGRVDMILTNDRAALQHYPDGTPAFHMPLAASRQHLREPRLRHANDFLFAGVPYPNRLRFFNAFTEALNGSDHRIRGLLLGPGWPTDRFEHAIDLRIETDDLITLYNESVATIYLGRDFDLGNDRFGIRASTPGPRLFEAAGAGACQIVMTPGLEALEYFAADDEIVFVDEARQAAEALLELKLDREKSLMIGRNAHRRALAQHLYVHRARKILKLLAEL